MRLGLSSWSYPWSCGVIVGPRPNPPLSPSELLDHAQKMGANVIQIADNMPLDTLSAHERAELRRRGSDSDIAIEVGTRGMEAAHMRRYLEIAQEMRSPILRTLLPDSCDSVDVARAKVESVLPIFEGSGVVLAIENYEILTSVAYADLMRCFDSDALGICLDTINNWGALESPYQVVRNLAPWTINLHMKEFAMSRVPSRLGIQVRGAPFGEGQMDALATVEFVLANRRRVTAIILEQWPPYQGNLKRTIDMEKAWVERGFPRLAEVVKTVAAT